MRKKEEVRYWQLESSESLEEHRGLRSIGDWGAYLWRKLAEQKGNMRFMQFNPIIFPRYLSLSCLSCLLNLLSLTSVMEHQDATCEQSFVANEQGDANHQQHMVLHVTSKLVSTNRKMLLHKQSFLTLIKHFHCFQYNAQRGCSSRICNIGQMLHHTLWTLDVIWASIVISEVVQRGFPMPETSSLIGKKGRIC